MSTEIVGVQVVPKKGLLVLIVVDPGGFKNYLLVDPVLHGRLVVYHLGVTEPEGDLLLRVLDGVRPVADVAPHL